MTMTLASAKPVATQVISSVVAPTPAFKCGTATLTIEASIVPMRVPKVIEMVTNHLLVGGRGAADMLGAGSLHEEADDLVERQLLVGAIELRQAEAHRAEHPDDQGGVEL